MLHLTGLQNLFVVLLLEQPVRLVQLVRRLLVLPVDDQRIAKDSLSDKRLEYPRYSEKLPLAWAKSWVISEIIVDQGIIAIGSL
jgi:hypothetical protein